MRNQGRDIECTEFLIKDIEAEQKYTFSLQKSLEKSRKEKFLGGMQFYLSSNVVPSFDILSRIIRTAGGRAWSLAEWSGDGYVISCDEDIDSEEVKSLIKRDVNIYDVELILTGVLRQRMNDLDEFLLA
jgi:hypothetical protein